MGWSAFVDALKNEDSDDYDRSFRPLTVLAPVIWLSIVWILMLGMLVVVGYLGDDRPPLSLQRLMTDLDGVEIDFAARRAALAFGGVTLAITLALALTSLFWCFKAWQGKSGAFRACVLLCVTAFLVASLELSWVAATHLKPFTSELGQALLQQGPKQLDAPYAQHVPLLMFVLSCVVPSVLVAGAGFLLQPMRWNRSTEALDNQVRLLTKRLRELEQMLYIGALALVFGTLQLSSGLSVGLVSMPTAAELKATSDLCKALAPSPASSATVSSSAPKATSSPSAAAFDAQCRELPGRASRLDSAESLRQLVHGITVCFGLSFSALLAAIYVPTLLVLRNMLEQRQEALSARGASTSAASPIVDSFSRIAAVAATLGPLFAGLLANTLAAG